MEKEYKTHYYTATEIRTIAIDLYHKHPVKEISRIRGAEFNRRGAGMLKKIRQIKRALEKGYTIQDIIKKETTETYNKKPEPMRQVRFYTEKEETIMKKAISSGEPIKSIARRLSDQFNRPTYGLCQKLHQLKKQIPNIKSRVYKEKLNFEPAIEQPADIGVDVPHGMTFEGKPKRITLHSDHFRIYF